MGVPFHRPYFDEAEIEAVTRALKRRMIGTGPIVAAFEKDFMHYADTAHAIAVNSCTSALHLALEALELGPGDEVITSPLTFCATLLAVRYTGATPVLADIDPVSLCLNPDEVLARVNERTKAILPVHYGGYPCEMDELATIAERYGLAIIEDAAHAFYTGYNGRRIGQSYPGVRSAACFSFHATKALSIGDGGMIVTADRELAERMISLRHFGMTRLAASDPSLDVSLQYRLDRLGYKYNMTDLEAAIGREQFKKAESMHRLRQQAAARYRELLDDIPGIVLPDEPPSGEHAWHLYVIQVPGGLRSRLIDRLNRSGIKTTIHFTPVYREPYFQPHFPAAASELPVTEAVADCVLSLPMFAGIRESELEAVAAAIRQFMREEGESCTP